MKSRGRSSKNWHGIAVLEIGIVTKSNLILRDIDLLKKIRENNQLFVNITITTLNVDLARILEPRAPRPDLRLEAMRQLNEAGVERGRNLRAGAAGHYRFAAQDLEALVRAVAEAGGKYVFANPLFLKPCSAAVFLPFLDQEFPKLAASYRERYKDGAFLPKTYGQRISQLMSRLREKYGIRNSYERYSRKSHPAVASQAGQLSLFD